MSQVKDAGHVILVGWWQIKNSNHISQSPKFSLSPLKRQPSRHEQSKVKKAGSQTGGFSPKGSIFPQNTFPSKAINLFQEI